MSDEERLSDIDRRSLRILAESSRTAATRLSERLERAAESGLRHDYEKAEQTFDSLPAEHRLLISAKAEKQAATERDLQERRRPAPPARTRDTEPDSSIAAASDIPAPADTDAPLEWKTIFEPAAAPSTDTPPPPPRRRKTAAKPAAEAAGAEPPEMSWKLGAIPGNPKMPKVGRTPKPPVAKVAPQPEDDWEDEHKDWDWRKLPDDPVLNGGRKKADKVDPLEELRRQMLGLDAKYGKR